MSFGLNVGMEMFAPLISGIVNNAVQLQVTYRSDLPQIINILHFCLIDSLLNYAADIIVSWVEVTAVLRPQIWRDECRSSRSRKLTDSHALWPGALSCWKMNSPENWLMEVSNCCDFLCKFERKTQEAHSSRHGLLEYSNFRMETANDAENVRVDTACGRVHDQNLVKTDTMISQDV